MKKFLLSILCLFCIIGYATADEAKFDFTAPSGLTPSITDEMFTAEKDGAFSFGTSGTTFTNNGVTLNTTDGSTAVSRIWKAAKGTYDLRVYKTATMTIAAPEGGVITAIALDGAAVSSFSANNGTVDGKNWTGSASSVVFTWADNAKTQKINTITVTFSTEGGTVTPDPEEPEGGEGEGEGETEVTYLTIAEVLAAGGGDAATKGTVVATYARGFLMNDGTGSILVFLNSAPAVAAGDAVTVSGKTSSYGGLLQFAAGTSVEKTGTATVTHPTATVMDGAAMDAYLTAPEIKYVEYTGTLTINGNYYNVAIEGAATAIGSIQYPQDDIKNSLTTNTTVKVTGYLIGVSNSKYVNTMAVKVEAVEPVEPEEPEGGEGEELEVTDISDIIDAGAGNAKAQGTIVATYARGFLLDDGTGSILVYLGTDNGHAAGDIVTVEGATSMYGGLLQFGNTSVVEKLTTTTVTYPTATAIDGAAMDAYLTAPAIQYVEYTGTLTINNNYYNVAVEGAATAVGSIQYPQDAIKANLTSGSVVKVTGYTIGVSSSKYVNTMAVKVETVGEGGGEEPEEPEVPTETQEYTVTEALAAYVDGKQIPAIVTGYIVGAVNNAPETGSQFGTDATNATNILISDNADTNDYKECLIVQLPSGDIRSELNLVDNPGNYKKQVKITGSVEKYFRVAGLKTVTAYEFTGVTGIEKVEIRNEKSEIYDLTGRRVETITAPGIYIVNGKKVLVR